MTLGQVGVFLAAGDTVAGTATVPRVSPDARDIKPADRDAILELLKRRDNLQVEIEKAVAKALKNGASIRGVVEGTGLASATVMKYGHSHGWPRPEDKAKFYETRWDRYRRDKEA